MDFLKKYPLPIAGLILAILALGNLLKPYGEGLRTVLGLIGGVLYLIYLIKLIVFNTKLSEALEHPVVASVFPTFTMATMLVPTYIKPYAPALVPVIWYIGVIGHVVLYLWFSKNHVLNFSIKKVFPSWYIVYVGIAVGSVSSPAVEQLKVGQIAFWLAFVSYFAILPFVLYRVWKVGEIPEPAKPTLIVLSAPASLLLAGYLSAFEVKSATMVYLLATLSYLFYFIALYYLPKLMMSKFSPSFSAFTFPLVISAIAGKMFAGYMKAGTVLAMLVKVQEAVAFCIVVFVLFHYMRFLFKSENA